MNHRCVKHPSLGNEEFHRNFTAVKGVLRVRKNSNTEEQYQNHNSFSLNILEHVFGELQIHI